MFSKTAILSYSNSPNVDSWEMQPEADVPITSLNLSGNGDYCKVYHAWNELKWYCDDGQPSNWTATSDGWNNYDASNIKYFGHHKKLALWFKKTSHNNTAGDKQVLYHNGSNLIGAALGKFKLYFLDGSNRLKLKIGCYNSSTSTYSDDTITFKGSVNEGVWHFFYLCWNTHTNKLYGWLGHKDQANGHEDCYYSSSLDLRARSDMIDGYTMSKEVNDWTADEEALMTYYYPVKNDTDFAIHTPINHANKTESYLGAKMDGSTASEFFYGSINAFTTNARYTGQDRPNDRTSVSTLYNISTSSWHMQRYTSGFEHCFLFGDYHGRWLAPDITYGSGNYAKGGKFIYTEFDDDFTEIGSTNVRFIYSKPYWNGTSTLGIMGGINVISADGTLPPNASNWRNPLWNNYSTSDSLDSRLGYTNPDKDNTDPTHDTSPYSTATNGWTYQDVQPFGGPTSNRKFVRDGSGQTSPGVLTNDMYISRPLPSGIINYTPTINSQSDSPWRLHGAGGGIVMIGHPYRVRMWLNVTQNSTSNDTITFGGVTIYDDNQSGEIIIDRIVQPVSNTGLVITAYSDGSGQSTSMEYLGGGFHYHVSTMIGVNLTGTVRGTGSIAIDSPQPNF